MFYCWINLTYHYAWYVICFSLTELILGLGFKLVLQYYCGYFTSYTNYIIVYQIVCDIFKQQQLVVYFRKIRLHNTTSIMIRFSTVIIIFFVLQIVPDDNSKTKDTYMTTSLFANLFWNRTHILVGFYLVNSNVKVIQ